eukprot:31334-Pelagococcus_subviridis.AAC.7
MPDEHLRERALPRAVLPHDRVRLAFFDRQRHAVEDRLARLRDLRGEVFHLEEDVALRGSDDDGADGARRGAGGARGRPARARQRRRRRQRPRGDRGGAHRGARRWNRERVRARVDECPPSRRRRG